MWTGVGELKWASRTKAEAGNILILIITGWVLDMPLISFLCAGTLPSVNTPMTA